MAMSFKEAMKYTNKKVADNRKKELTENKRLQSPKNIEAMNNYVKGIRNDFTPYGLYHYGNKAVKSAGKKDYWDTASSGINAILSAIPLAGPTKAVAKQGYKGLKSLFQGPLSPQYNSRGAFVNGLMNEGQTVFNMLMKKLNPMYENANATLLTGQGGDIGKNFVKNNMGVYTQPKVSLSPKAAIADDYAMKQAIGDGSAGSGKRLLVFPYNQNEKFKNFTENTISNIGNSVVHGGPEVRVGPLALEKSTKNLIGKKPLSFPAASATYGRKNIPGQVDTPGNLGMLSRLSDDEFRNWASKNVFSKGGKVK